jgi:ribosomal-protein-alanine N-acetyltransferase
MRVEDVPQVIAIADSLKEAPHWHPGAYLSALEPDTYPPGIALVAEDPVAGVVGFVVAALIPPQAEVQSIAVAKPAQRHGIARRLLGELVAVLKERRITEVMLEVRESNRAARALYFSLGFAETGRRKGYYYEPKEDAVLLSRSDLGAT